MQSKWSSYLDSRSQVKVKGFNLEFLVCSISPEPFDRFSLKSTHVFLLVRGCAKHMTELPSLKVKITGQGQSIYLEFCVRSISPEPFDRFSWSFTHTFVLVRQCAEYITQLPRLKVTGQGQRIYPWISVRSISPELFDRFSWNFTHMFLFRR